MYPEKSIRAELGPAMTLHFLGEAPAVHCTYIRTLKPGRAPRKLLNLSIILQLLDDFFAVNSCPTLQDREDPASVTLGYDENGKPQLNIGEFSDMAVSFSHISDMLWASLSCSGNHLGMDVARAEEFEGNYPFQRAFHPEELYSSRIDIHEIRESAALLWSVKEAVVKALGIGYGVLGPLDIRIESIEDCATHYIPRIFIAPAALRGIGLRSSTCLNLISFSHAGSWISVAIRPKQALLLCPCNEQKRASRLYY